MPRKRTSKKTSRKSKPKAKRAKPKRKAPKAAKRAGKAKKARPKKPPAKRVIEKEPITKAPIAAEEPAKPKRVDVSPELRRIWLGVRRAYNLSYDAFYNSLSSLRGEEADMLYALSVAALYKGNVAQILSEHPELRGMIHTDEDRLCLHDCYQYLSAKLGRSEPLPKERAVMARFRQAARGSIIP